MSHLFKRGFFVRQPAWHGLGEVLDEYPGREEAMRIAGHDHTVSERVIFVSDVPFRTDRQVEPLNHDDLRGVTAYKAIVRDDDATLLSVMPASYPVIQNDKPWDLIDAICNVDNVRYETGGVLGGRFGSDDDGAPSWEMKRGTVYWVLAHLDEPHRIGNDPSPVYPFILGTWDHGGLQALRVKETDVRVVCANTQALALRGAGREFDVSFRHVGNVNERIAEAQLQVANVRAAHTAFVERANELAAMEVSDVGLERFVEIILPLPEIAREQLMSDRQVHNVETARAAVHALLDGRTCNGIRNTAWGLVQAGVEYHDHLRRVIRADSYFRRNLMHVSKAKAALEETAELVAAEFPA